MDSGALPCHTVLPRFPKFLFVFVFFFFTVFSLKEALESVLRGVFCPDVRLLSHRLMTDNGHVDS